MISIISACRWCGDEVVYSEYFMEHWGDLSMAWFYYQAKPWLDCQSITQGEVFLWYQLQGYNMTDRIVINLADSLMMNYTCPNETLREDFAGEIFMVSSAWWSQLTCCEEPAEIIGESSLGNCCPPKDPLPTWAIVIICVLPFVVLIALQVTLWVIRVAPSIEMPA